MGFEMTLPETMSLGETFAKSGFFQDVKSAAQAVVKILAGRELGFGPMASMAGVHVIEGKPAIGSHLMAAKIKGSERYDYAVKTLTAQECEVEFWEYSQSSNDTIRKGRTGWKIVGSVRVSMKEFVDSGLAIDKHGNLKSNWRRSPDDMLFARAISKGFRRYCPDLTGILVYTSEEMQDVEPQQALPVHHTTTDATEDVQDKHPEPTVIDAPAAPALPAFIDDTQQAELAALLRDTNSDGAKFCAFLQVPVLSRLPADRFAEAKGLLERKRDAAKTTNGGVNGHAQPATETSDQAERSSLQGKIDELCLKLKIPQKAFADQVKKVYGADDITKLSVFNLKDLVGRLTNKLAGQAVPA